jgi:hypothetical protein
MLGELSEKTQWKTKALLNLRYDLAKPMCKFALFLSAHDTIPDSSSPGLMQVGVTGTRSYIDPRLWISPDFKTIEHVAPVKGEGVWDNKLYESEKYQSVGNLTLLPGDVNSSAGNQAWGVKSIYYRHMAEKDPIKLSLLAQEASLAGVHLQAHTIDLLKNSTYSNHMESVVSVSSDMRWDYGLVESRSERICEIVWYRVAPWLGLVS